MNKEKGKAPEREPIKITLETMQTLYVYVEEGEDPSCILFSQRRESNISLPLIIHKLELLNGYARKLDDCYISRYVHPRLYEILFLLRTDDFGGLSRRNVAGGRTIPYKYPDGYFTLVVDNKFIPMCVTATGGRAHKDGPEKTRFCAAVINMNTLRPVPDVEHDELPTKFKWLYLPKAKPELCWVVEDDKHKHRNAYCLWGHILEEHPLGGFDEDRFDDERVK